jgi:hypothetical protein
MGMGMDMDMDTTTGRATIMGRVIPMDTIMATGMATTTTENP